jgi:acyl-CoA reductase-like NAD-dependent aldehyde dehydrogenase
MSGVLITNTVFADPIIPVMKYSTDEEAITKANNTLYGLGASVGSCNVDRTNKIAHQIEAGNVWVNTYFELDPRASFGGHKQSGIGAECGVTGLMSYCNAQTLFLGRGN